jgi:hypothetical protein
MYNLFCNDEVVIIKLHHFQQMKDFHDWFIVEKIIIRVVLRGA